MSLLYLPPALLAAIALYLASPHQSLWPHRPRPRRLRQAACLLLAVALAAAIVALGVVAGVAATLAVLMLGLVLAPLLDAWRRARLDTRGEAGHVG